MLSILSRISAFILIFLPICAYGLIVGTYTSPPFSMHEDDEFIGLATEVVEELLRQSGITDYKILDYPLARGLAELEYGRIDILYPYLIHLKKPDQQHILIGPISKYQISLFVRKDYEGDVSISAMKNLVMGVERGSISNAFLDQMHIKIEQSTQEISCLKMVLANRIPVCAMGTLPGMYAAAINGIYDRLKYHPTNLNADLYVAISHNLPREIIDKLRSSYNKLRAGNYFDLKQKDYEKKFNIFIRSLS